MDPQTFIHFPRLPIELRLKIWKQACQPLSPNQRGIHYIDFGHDGVVPLPCNWSQPSTEQFPREINHSAYLIDGGLWTACKESREVILKHTNYDDWIEIQDEAMDEDEPFRSYCRQESWPEGEEIPHPATMDLEKAGQEWHMLVYPEHDIFCIKAARWKSTYKAMDNYLPCMSFARGKPLRFEGRGKHGDFSFEWLNAIRIHNIAFEFDQSWMKRLPKNLYYLTMGKSSARKCWSHYLLKSSSNDQRNVWIIDKSAKWLRDSDRDYDTIYRDCEADYVEADLEDIFDHTGDGISASVSAFINACCNTGILRDGYARLLVRRDNEVMPWRLGNCRKECGRIGWCVCNGGENNGDGLF